MSLGIFELFVILVLAVATASAAAARHKWTPWLLAASVCCAVSALLTPADVVSTLLFGGLGLCAYWAGTRQSSAPAHDA